MLWLILSHFDWRKKLKDKDKMNEEKTRTHREREPKFAEIDKHQITLTFNFTLSPVYSNRHTQCAEVICQLTFVFLAWCFFCLSSVGVRGGGGGGGVGAGWRVHLIARQNLNDLSTRRSSECSHWKPNLSNRIDLTWWFFFVHTLFFSRLQSNSDNFAAWNFIYAVQSAVMSFSLSVVSSSSSPLLQTTKLHQLPSQILIYIIMISIRFLIMLFSSSSSSSYDFFVVDVVWFVLEVFIETIILIWKVFMIISIKIIHNLCLIVSFIIIINIGLGLLARKKYVENEMKKKQIEKCWKSSGIQR